jgi:hypothetical protein
VVFSQPAERAETVALGRTDAIIAGVNKAGTTSLFVSLSRHPDVAPSSVKETGFFLAARYGRSLPPAEQWDAYFAAAGARPVRLEATPSYFYGGAAVADAMLERLTNPHALVVLREPVSRALSFFTYQKVRLRFPPDYSIAEYLAAADRLSADDFQDPDNEKFMAFRGGCYAEFVPGWLETFGAPRLHVVDFDRLVGDPATTLRGIARQLGLDPARFPAEALSSENRTTGYRSRGIQRVALFGNDRLERLLRRHPETKRRLRDVYYRVNGRAASEEIPQSVRDELAARYEEPNARLEELLAGAGIPIPGWLASSDRSGVDAGE